MCHLVRGYFSLVQGSLCEIGQVSICCLKETEPSIQLHGAKVTPCGSFDQCSGFLHTPTKYSTSLCIVILIVCNRFFS